MMVPLRRLLVLALIPLAKGGSSPDPWAEGVAKGKLALHRMEGLLKPACSFARKHSRSVRLFASGAVLFHGGQFSHSMLLYQSLSVSAGPLLGEAVADVASSYSDAREALEKSVPDIVAARKELAAKYEAASKIHEKMEAARASFRAGELEPEALRAILKEGLEATARLGEDVEKLEALESSVSAVLHAVDGDKLKKVGLGLYAAYAAAVAAATSRTAATVTVGLNLGHQATQSLKAVVVPIVAKVKVFLSRQRDTRSRLEDMPPRLKKGLHAAIRAAATAGGVLFAYTQKQSTLMISICYVAAGNVLRAATDMVNPVLRSNDLDALVLTADDPAFATAHVALAAVGVLAQLSGAPIPLPVRILFKPALAPLALVEKALRAATLNNIRRGL